MSATTTTRRVVLAHNNGYDTILLLHEGWVVGAWGACSVFIQDYLAFGDTPDEWDENHPECDVPEGYGRIVGEGGRIDDEGRRLFWADIIGKAVSS